jgi:23S rRNA (adenine2030-N6)-methyltransferase
VNYRHAFHAGNFADVWKHLVLTLCLDHLRLKPAPFRVIDAFAGIGWYDLDADEARRSPEWREGIGRVREAAARTRAPVPVTRFLAAIDTARAAVAPDLAPHAFYPGSPGLIASALRTPDEGERDRAIVCELHPADAETLDVRFARDRAIVVEARDGWTATRAHLPPVERRGLVLIDPPFEEQGEFARLVQALDDGLTRFATGTFVLWHADKAPRDTARYRADIVALGARALGADLRVAEPENARGLVSAGLTIINPPHTLEADLTAAGAWLAPVLARGPGASARVARLSGRW